MKRRRNQRAVAGNSLRLGAEAVERSGGGQDKCRLAREARSVLKCVTKQRHAVRGTAAFDNERTTTDSLSKLTITDRPTLLTMTIVALLAL